MQTCTEEQTNSVSGQDNEAVFAGHMTADLASCPNFELSVTVHHSKCLSQVLVTIRNFSNQIVISMSCQQAAKSRFLKTCWQTTATAIYSQKSLQLQRIKSDDNNRQL